MMRTRFPVAALAALTVSASAAVYAQSAPPQKALPAATRIDDIQISREGETVSILVKLSQQPAAATAKASGDDLVVEIDGVQLAKLALDPPAGSLVRHVEAAERKLTLSGAAFGAASTVIYRNAVLIETRLAEPELRGASLLRKLPPASVTPPAPVQPAPKETPKALPVAEAAPPPKAAEPASSLESHPIALVPQPAQKPVAPPPAPRVLAAALAGIDAARCKVASEEVEKDPWALAALGDHALCLIDAGKANEGKNRIDQLAAFAPEDWRVSLGRAALDAAKGDASNAEIGYRAAAQLAPNADIRAAITAKLEKPADH
jgi:hypothetical protein